MGAQASSDTAGSVAIGNHANVTQSGNIALVANSVGSMSGYIPERATVQQAATTSTEVTLSMEDASKGIYRQITGVAADTADTDAVNIPQFKGINAQMETITRNLNYINDHV